MMHLIENDIWPFVLAFIQQRDPAFLSQVEGVSDNVIFAMAAKYGVMLPACYVEFLQKMGANSNGYFPFGATHAHSFNMLTEHPGDDDESAPPANRFFRAAIETDESVVALFDYYLDLHLSNNFDAPLVILEQGVPFDWQTPVDTHETFGERIINSVFNHFQLSRCTEHGVVSMGGTLHAGEGRMSLQQALVLFQNAGFTPALPLTDRLACLQSGPVSVLARVNEEYELLTMQVGSNNRQSVKQLTDQLLAGLPGARRPEYDQ